MMEIKEFINGKVTFDRGGYFFIEDAKDGSKMLADMRMRGWGFLQSKFKTAKEAAEFQDKLGDWIADAITKSWREKICLHQLA